MVQLQEEQCPVYVPQHVEFAKALQQEFNQCGIESKEHPEIDVSGI